MEILYSPQFNENKIEYKFDVDIVTITIDEQTETFDFANMPDGKAETIESDVFDFCPVLSAERKEGVLYLEILNFIGLDATEEERFPEWKEVVFDG